MAWITEYQRWLSEEESLNNAGMVYTALSGTDWSDEAIAALCGNMRHESSINPDMYEYGYAWSADRGYGLVQWTPRSKYWDWASARGLDQRSGDSQLARISYEVENNIQWIPISRYNGMTFTQFRTNSGGWSVEYLTEAFTWSYERPNAQAGEDSMAARKAFALKAYEAGGGTGGGGGKPFYPTTDTLPMNSSYGWRTDPITGEQAFHDGGDISGQGVNHPIYATQSGKVIVNTYNDISGYYVRIEHTGDPYISGYQHLQVPSPLPVGTIVQKGERIGTMGTTGKSTGIHLHFQIATSPTGFYTEAGTIDPALYLAMDFGTSPEQPGDGGSGDWATDPTRLMLLRQTNMRRDMRRR